MTTGEDRPVVIDLSTSHGEDRYMNRSVKRRRSVGRRLPVKAESVFNEGRYIWASDGTWTYRKLGSPYTHKPPCTFGGRVCGHAE